jgi:hypothetical protein
MSTYVVKVPDPKKLANTLQAIEQQGSAVKDIVFVSGYLVILAQAGVGPLPDYFLLLEDGSYLLQEDSGKIIL